MIRRGAVTSFDAAQGIGTLRGAEGRESPFHCTAIADGSRLIDEGTAVAYRLVPGHGGRWEATDLTPVAPADR